MTSLPHLRGGPTARRRYLAAAAVVLFATTSLVTAQQTQSVPVPPAGPPPPVGVRDLEVQSVDPVPNNLSVPIDATIMVRFDKPVDPASLVPDRTFWAFGRWSGTASGELSLSPNGRVVTLTPDRNFSAGELVTVVIANSVQGLDGSNVRASGYSYQFTTRTEPSDMVFERVEVLDLRGDSGQQTKAYGGVGADMNGDGYLDISIVNEISADMRTFVNKGTAPGYFDADYLAPPAQCGTQASPSETADFNGDGNVDVAIANILDDTVSILMGAGDGTFTTQTYPVGPRPRGIAICDADGDGDMDVINTNSTVSTISILTNQGDSFSGPTTVDVGVPGVFGVWAADFDNDLVMDLVIGSMGVRQVFVYRGNGDGTFSYAARQDVFGDCWQITCGDVDGDGNVDVTVATGLTNKGAILRGLGDGSLAPPVLHDAAGWTTATDIGDLDGDGDLDWILSGFFGDWTVYRNDGNGNFIFAGLILSPDAASCSVMMDFDNDRDLDLAMIDENADVVIAMVNRQLGTIPCSAVRNFHYECNGDGTVDLVLSLQDRTQHGRVATFYYAGQFYEEVVVVEAQARLTVPYAGAGGLATAFDPAGCSPIVSVDCP